MKIIAIIRKEFLICQLRACYTLFARHGEHHWRMKLHASEQWRVWRKSTSDKILCIRQMSQKTGKYNKSIRQIFCDFKIFCDKVRRKVPVLIFNYIKYSGYFLYHQIVYSETLHSAHGVSLSTAHDFSRQAVIISLYSTDWLIFAIEMSMFPSK